MYNEEDWHMPIDSSQYFIILFRINQVFTSYHFIMYYIILYLKTEEFKEPWSP